MPAQIPELETMDEDKMIKEVLDKFVNCHEQTYEEFLSTFTYLSKDVPLLPGEVENVSTHIPPGIPPAADILPAAAQPLTPAVNPRPTVEGADTQKDETLGDEVQPFRLDEEFDYDSVILTPKFTSAEIEAIKEQLSKHKRENTNSDLEEPRD
uniref:Intraflagellar transport associated protein n=1 Tax=Pipistrellus kuhlii TaxID=59472 RepID=A0A7J7WZD6_PIPKU|nr:hypothetical protein mPipKuh1_001641 [Pipistrellus kuhlii]